MEQEYLKSCLEYDPVSGLFTWKHRDNVPKSTNTRMTGKIAGTIAKTHGYRVIRIDGKLYLAHRLAFLYMTGSIPEFVDHKNRVRTDCSWNNLRASTRQQNNINVTPTSNTGELNIYWVEDRQYWLVSVKRDGKAHQKTIKSSIEDAISYRDHYIRSILNEKPSSTS